MINLLLQDLTGAQCLKHSFLGIAHLIFFAVPLHPV